MIENNAALKAGLSFSNKRGRLLIHHATIRALGEPDYVRLLLNKRDKRLAVQCCEEIDSDHFRVPAAVEGQDYRFEISSVGLISVIVKTCGLDSNKTYLVYGTHLPKYRLVEFDLAEVREIHQDQFEDPENMSEIGL